MRHEGGPLEPGLQRHERVARPLGERGVPRSEEGEARDCGKADRRARGKRGKMAGERSHTEPGGSDTAAGACAQPGTRAMASISSMNSGFTSRSITRSVFGGYFPPGKSFGNRAERADMKAGMLSALVR